jgi:dihydroorotate dehydrogenase electron transfer subunit
LKYAAYPILSNRLVLQYSGSGCDVKYHLICVDAPDIATAARPGQFVTVGCGPDFTLRRPLSIHRLDESGKIYFLFAVVGGGTLWLSQRLKGEELDLLGPLGNGFSVQPTSKKLLLAAGGIGIAPLVFLAQKGQAEGKPVRLILCARQKEGLYPKELLPKEIETLITTEDGSAGRRGKVSDILPEHIDWADQVFACGPLAMYQAIAGQSKRWRNKKPVQVSLEVRMGCGVGACLGCSINTKKGMKRVCRDGPVFDLDEVLLEGVRI